jgi:hypothetical protein
MASVVSFGCGQVNTILALRNDVHDLLQTVGRSIACFQCAPGPESSQMDGKNYSIKY